MKPRGQVDIWANAATAAVTAAVIGAGAFIWGQIKPEPKDDRARAVSEALQAREVVDLRRTVDEHTAILKVVVPQLQRIEDAVTPRLDSATRPAGKRSVRQGP